jgi:hypothetical protein
LTCDVYLVLFDQMQARKENRLPCVILPNNFWQMLRPYMKSDIDFDKAFAETFALPEFSVIGSGGSRACSKMLGILAAYKDFPEETATRLLTDGVLADNLSQATNDAEFNALVEAAIVEQNAELMEEKAALERQAQQEAETRKALEATVNALQSEVTSQKRSLDAATVAAEQASERAKAIQQASNAETDARRLAEIKASGLEQQVTLAFGVLGAFLAVMLIAGLEAIIYLTNTGFSVWIRSHPHSLGLQLSVGAIIALVSMGLFLRRYRKWLLLTGALSVFAVILQII